MNRELSDRIKARQEFVDRAENCMAYLAMGPDNLEHYQAIYDLFLEINLGLVSREEFRRGDLFPGFLGRYKMNLARIGRKKAVGEIYDSEREMLYIFITKNERVTHRMTLHKSQMDASERMQRGI
ncbi:MAG TPA: hypothetical protein ENH99_03080 [Candidatus Pacearchaeota archaeon]|nr:hypothetical protein [Candidatus Pacearchaeota archaeon]